MVHVSSVERGLESTKKYLLMQAPVGKWKIRNGLESTKKYLLVQARED